MTPSEATDKAMDELYEVAGRRQLEDDVEELGAVVRSRMFNKLGWDVYLDLNEGVHLKVLIEEILRAVLETMKHNARI